MGATALIWYWLSAIAIREAVLARAHTVSRRSFVYDGPIPGSIRKLKVGIGPIRGGCAMAPSRAVRGCVAACAMLLSCTAVADGRSPEHGRVVSEGARSLPDAEPHGPSALALASHDSDNLRGSPGVKGLAGLLHVLSADPGPAGQLRLSVLGEYFRLNDFPVASGTDSRLAGTFAASLVPLDFLELSLAYGDAVNTSSRTSPNLIQTLGNFTLGAKVTWQWAPGFHAGVALLGTALSGSGIPEAKSYAFGLSPLVLATYDVRAGWPAVPLVLHGNAGAAFEGSTLPSTRILSAAEEFAFRANRFNRLTLGVGAQAPLGALAPFVEYNMAYPLGVPARGLFGPDGISVPVARAMEHAIGLGLTLTAVKDVTFTAAVDLGLSRSVGLGIPATPAYDLFLGMALHLNPFGPPAAQAAEPAKERQLPVARPARTGRIRGIVLDVRSHKPVAGAIVTTQGSGMPPVASDSEAGAFATQELPIGNLSLLIQKGGYHPATREIVLGSGETADVHVELQPLPGKATLLVTVRGDNRPVAAAVSLRSAVDHQQLSTLEGAQKPVRVEVFADKYVAEVFARGYLAQTREVQLSNDAQLSLDFELHPQPKKKLVMIKESRIGTLQQVHFAPGKSKILADSDNLLQQVVDAIVQHNIKRIRIEGHTDNLGGRQFNQKLSEERAAAVAAFLKRAGIEESRLESAGFGDTRPVAPNITAHGREFNRRVEFIILER